MAATTFGEKYPRQNFQHDPYELLIVQNQERGETGARIVRGWLPEEVAFDVAAQYEAPFAQGLSGVFPLSMVGPWMKAMGVSLITQAMTAQVWQGSTEINFTLPITFVAEKDAYSDVIMPIKQLLKMAMPKEPVPGGLLEAPGPHVNIDRLSEAVGEPLDLATPTPQQKEQQTLFGETGNFFSSLISGTGDLVKNAGQVFQDIKNKPVNTLVSMTKGIKNAVNKPLVSISRALVNAIDDNISLYIGNFFYFPCVVVTDVSNTFNILIAPDGNPSSATVNVTMKTFFIPTQNDIDRMFPSGGGQSSTQSAAVESGAPQTDPIFDYNGVGPGDLN